MLVLSKIDGEKTYEGTLKDLNQDQIVLEVKIKTRRKEITIPRKTIASSRFAVESRKDDQNLCLKKWWKLLQP